MLEFYIFSNPIQQSAHFKQSSHKLTEVFLSVISAWHSEHVLLSMLDLYDNNILILLVVFA